MNKNIILVLIVLFAFSNCKKLKVYSEVDYLIDATKITWTKNPSGFVPLSAHMAFISNNALNCELYVNGSLVKKFDTHYNDSIDLNLLNLKLNFENKVSLKLFESISNNFQTIEKIFYFEDEEILPEIDITFINNKANDYLCLMYHGLGDALNTIPFVFDGNGEIIWYFKDPTKNRIISGFEFLNNGNFFFAIEKKLYEVDWMGNFIDSIDVFPYAPHHDLIELSNGNYLFPASLNGSEKEFDWVVEVDPKNKQIVNEIDLNLILDWDRNEMGSSPRDRFHVNSIWEDENDGAIIMSVRNQGLVKFDLSGNLVWILSPHLGWKEEFKDKLLTPVNAEGVPYNDNIKIGFTSAENFDYSWSQHAAMQNSNGNIEVFDNGFYRNFSLYGIPFSRAVEYAIDEQNKTVQQVWSFKGVDKKDFYSLIVGDVDEIDATTSLVLSGTNWNNKHKALIYEIDKSTNTLKTGIKLFYKDAGGNGQNQFLQYDYIYRVEKTKVPTIF